MIKHNLIIIAVVALVFSAGGGFFAGMKYQEQKTPDFPGRFGQRPAGQMQPEGQNSRRPISGEITSIDDGSVTVSLPDGGSKIVLLTDSTAVNKTEKVSGSDLLLGEEVQVLGQENADGSVTAESVFIGQPKL